MISDKKEFASKVLPRFYGHSKYTSFTRRLKRWSFTRVPSGPYLGAYYNENFRRDEPQLACRVRYDHPAPLSAGILHLDRAKAQAAAQAAAAKAGIGGLGRTAADAAYGDVKPPQVNPPLAHQPGMAGQGAAAAAGDGEALLRQVQAMNAAGINNAGIWGGMGQASQSGPVQNLLQAVMAGQGQVGGYGGAFAASNGNVALQMALAQQAMQQRQAQARAQAMAAGQLVGAAGAQGQSGGVGAMSAHDQVRLALAQQQMQQQQRQGQGNQGQMPLGNKVQENQAGRGKNNGSGLTLATIQSAQTGGNAAVNSHILTKPPQGGSGASLTTLQGGRRPRAPSGGGGGGNNVNFPNANLGSFLGYAAGLGGGAGAPSSAGATATAAGSASQNQASVNALLADLLSRQAGGGGNGDEGGAAPG
ncbi:hypothetical protein ACHAWF_012909 [Thalassiosira exigua]